MLHPKIKKMALPIIISVLTTLMTPALTQAEPYSTGDIASKRAEEQRAAIAKRAERKKKEAEAKKAAQAGQAKPAEATSPAEAPGAVQAPAATEPQSEKPVTE